MELKKQLDDALEEIEEMQNRRQKQAEMVGCSLLVWSQANLSICDMLLNPVYLYQHVDSCRAVTVLNILLCHHLFAVGGINHSSERHVQSNGNASWWISGEYTCTWHSSYLGVFHYVKPLKVRDQSSFKANAIL